MEQRTARNWYWWLWLSPLVTVPSLSLLAAVAGMLWSFLQGPAGDQGMAERVAYSLAVVGSSLWHLILLFPALNAKSEFVRWHGRQALLLAGVRTVVPLGFVWAFGSDDRALISGVPLIAVWFIGTLWGQLQAARGKCGLMRLFGRADAQPARVDDLVAVIRYSRDPEERRTALAKLADLGMVESL